VAISLPTFILTIYNFPEFEKEISEDILFLLLIC